MADQVEEIKNELKKMGIEFSGYNPYQRADLVNAYIQGFNNGLKLNCVKE